MSDGLNKAFTAAPQTFLQNTSFVADDNSFSGGSGVYTVNFKNVGGTVLLKKAEGTGTFSNKFSAYFLKAVANNDNQGVGFAGGATIMFTSTIQGCQFLAYGASRSAPTVEHNNHISNPGNYAARYGAVAAGAAHKIRFGNGNGYNLDSVHTYNVVGFKSAGGAWDFYVQTSDLTVPSSPTMTVTQLNWT